MDIVIKKNGKQLENKGDEVGDYVERLNQKLLSFVEDKLDIHERMQFQDDMERLRFATNLLNESSPLAVLSVILLMATTDRDRVKLDAARVIGNWTGLEKTGELGVVVNLSELEGGDIRGEIIEMENGLVKNRASAK